MLHKTSVILFVASIHLTWFCPYQQGRVVGSPPSWTRLLTKCTKATSPWSPNLSSYFCFPKYLLLQRPEKFFCQEPGSKYFWFCGSNSLLQLLNVAVVIQEQPQTVCEQMGMALFQAPLIVDTEIWILCTFPVSWSVILLIFFNCLKCQTLP